jgi:hypothetical protein
LLILPPPKKELSAVAALADTAVTLGISNRFLPYFQFTKALAQYRQADFDGALDWAGRTLANDRGRTGYQWDNYLYVEAYSVVAMAHFRLNHEIEARAVLAKAAESAPGGPGTG